VGKAQNRLFACPAPLEGGEKSLTVLFCIPDTPDWRQTIAAMVGLLEYGRSWDEATGSVIDSQAIGREIFSSMAMCDLEAQLIRIAVSLESLDAKASQFYSMQNFLDDLAETIGVADVFYQIFSALIGLMPRLSAKVDATWAVKAFLEWYSWKAPILSLLTAIATAQGVMAAAAVKGAVLGIIDTVFAGVAILQTTALGWKDIILGDKSVWNDILRPMWSILFADDDDGTGGTQDDVDERTRVTLDTGDLNAKLEEIRVMLETRLIAETVAGNTRSAAQAELLNAIEDILGGDFESA